MRTHRWPNGPCLINRKELRMHHVVDNFMGKGTARTQQPPHVICSPLDGFSSLFSVNRLTMGIQRRVNGLKEGKRAVITAQ